MKRIENRSKVFSHNHNFLSGRDGISKTNHSICMKFGRYIQQMSLIVSHYLQNSSDIRIHNSEQSCFSFQITKLDNFISAMKENLFEVPR